MELDDVDVEGRHASNGNLHPLRRNNMVASVSCCKKNATIRLDDKKNLDFWLHINITRETLEAILKEMDESDE